MNRRILLASYAIIGAQMMAATSRAPHLAPTPEPEPLLPDYCGEGKAPSSFRQVDCMDPLPVRGLYREIDPMQAALNRQARRLAGFKARR